MDFQRSVFVIGSMLLGRDGCGDTCAAWNLRRLRPIRLPCIPKEFADQLPLAWLSTPKDKPLKLSEPLLPEERLQIFSAYLGCPVPGRSLMELAGESVDSSDESETVCEVSSAVKSTCNLQPPDRMIGWMSWPFRQGFHPEALQMAGFTKQNSQRVG